MADRVTAELRRAGLSPRTGRPASGGFGVEPSAPADPPDVAAYVVWNAADELAEPAFDRLGANDLKHRAGADPGGDDRGRAGDPGVRGSRRANEHRRPRPGDRGGLRPGRTVGAMSILPRGSTTPASRPPGRPGSATARPNTRSFAPWPPRPGTSVTRWIRSMGGPLVLLPRHALPVWTGAYGPSGEDDIDEEEEETGYCWVGEQGRGLRGRGGSWSNGSPGIPRPRWWRTPCGCSGRSAGSTRRRG
jgi:hypothetical protein